MRYFLFVLAALVLSACVDTSTRVDVVTTYRPTPGQYTDSQLWAYQPQAQPMLRNRVSGADMPLVASGAPSTIAIAKVFGPRSQYGMCREQYWGGNLVYVCYDKRWLDNQPFNVVLLAQKQPYRFAGLSAPVFVVGPIWGYRPRHDWMGVTYRYR